MTRQPERAISSARGPKERGILFSAPMVRAILTGRKTQTRRIVKMPPNAGRVHIDPGGTIFGPGPYLKVELAKRDANKDPTMHPRNYCPYGYPGDRLWVREAHALLPSDAPWSPPIWHKGGGAVLYRADLKDGEPMPSAWAFDRWRPGIHMHRWASRIDLAITGIRVQRLQDISEHDAQAEGVDGPVSGTWPDGFGSWSHDGKLITGRPWAHKFLQLWMQIHGHESAHANPWVWVVEFRRDHSRINELIERSSIGAAMADIRERGIDAHAEDLARQTRPMRRRKR